MCLSACEFESHLPHHALGVASAEAVGGLSPLNIRSHPVDPLLEVKNLQTYFFTYEGVVKAVDDITYEEYCPAKRWGWWGRAAAAKA